MKLSTVSFILLLAANTNRDVVGFRAGSDGNKQVTKSVDDLLAEVKPVQSFAGEAAPPLRNQILHTESSARAFEYWSRPDIHTFGNMGLGGAFHAAMAPLATKLIDWKAYDGEDVRKSISHELRMLVSEEARVVDLCCGVGMSTRALEAGFSDAEFVVGVDTSSEMVSMARAMSGYEQGVRRCREAINKVLNGGTKTATTVRASYQIGNAEDTSFDLKVDVVSIMFAFHEVPMDGRVRILKEARRLLKRGGILAVVDICPSYEPSPYMLAGEPFVKEYQRNINRQLETHPGFTFWKRKFVVPGHVNLSLLAAC